MAKTPETDPLRPIPEDLPRPPVPDPPARPPVRLPRPSYGYRTKTSPYLRKEIRRLEVALAGGDVAMANLIANRLERAYVAASGKQRPVRRYGYRAHSGSRNYDDERIENLLGRLRLLGNETKQRRVHQVNLNPKR